MREYLIGSFILLILAYIQNVSFSIVSRSRNRSSMTFHLIASIFSNSIWFLTFRHLVTRDMSLVLFPWYCVGTVFGSVTGVKISMWIETLLHADSDSHLKSKVDLQALQTKVYELELMMSYHKQHGYYPEQISPMTNPFTADTISDGFGNICSVYCPTCKQRTMQVVRPGKFQCINCG